MKCIFGFGGRLCFADPWIQHSGSETCCGYTCCKLTDAYLYLRRILGVGVHHIAVASIPACSAGNWGTDL